MGKIAMLSEHAVTGQTSIRDAVFVPSVVKTSTLINSTGVRQGKRTLDFSAVLFGVLCEALLT